MIATWLLRFLALAELSSSTLRATVATFTILGIMGKQRAEIEHELAMRAWADAVEERLHTVLRWCGRGGLS